MGKRKFDIGDKIKVKHIKGKGLDAEEVRKRVGKIGTIQSYAPEDDYPYNVEFTEDEIEDLQFRASELDKVEEK